MSPALISSSVPSSILMTCRPERTYPTCAASQLSVPAIGFTCSDHSQPGSNVARSLPDPVADVDDFYPSFVLKRTCSSGSSKRLRSQSGHIPVHLLLFVSLSLLVRSSLKINRH